MGLDSGLNNYFAHIACVCLVGISWVGSYELCSFFLIMLFQQCYFFLLLCHCNVSIMLKIMLGFHRNNHKPTAQTKALCDMITHECGDMSLMRHHES